MMRKFFWNDPESKSAIVSNIRSEGLIAGSSDTVPGFFAPLTLDGFEQLNSIKGRTNKPYLVLINDSQKSFLFSSDGGRPEIARLMKACWPGPLTLILNAQKNVAPYITSESGTVALRVPKHAGLLELLGDFDGLFSTSANFAGKPTPQLVADIDPAIIERVAMVVHDRQERSTHLPSTIVDCTGPTLRIVREGAYSRDELNKFGIELM